MSSAEGGCENGQKLGVAEYTRTGKLAGWWRGEAPGEALRRKHQWDYWDRLLESATCAAPEPARAGVEL